MARVREHINGLDLTNVIAAFTKDGGVTGKRGRSAGNVDDAFGTHGKDGVKNGPLTAGSWRIKDNDVGADSVPHKKGQLFSRISTDEFTVFDVIVPGIFSGVSNRWCDNLDSQGVPCLLGEKKGNRSCAAVKVDNVFLSFKGGIGKGSFIKALRLQRIDLEEVMGGNDKG